jgi:hypothetical protein
MHVILDDQRGQPLDRVIVEAYYSDRTVVKASYSDRMPVELTLFLPSFDLCVF